MKKIVIIALSFALFVSSCSNNTGTGTAVGAQFGSVIGSAIGGLTGGRYGRELGTVIGMAGGAAAGAAIGSAADKKQKRQMEEYQQEAYEQYQQQQGTTIEQLSTDTSIEIRNIRFVNGAQDGIIFSGEQCQLVFEIMNLSAETIYDVRPMVTDVTANKYLHISQNLAIESIAPNNGVRYTATITADKKLDDGEAVIRVSVNHGNVEVSSQTQELKMFMRKVREE